MSRTSGKVECRKYGTGEQDALRARLHAIHSMLAERVDGLHPEQCPLAHGQLEKIEILANELASLADRIQQSMETT